jgi:hypothetical protein
MYVRGYLQGSENGGVVTIGPELIPDIEKFLPVAIFKMVATIPHKFNIIRFQRHFICR